MVVNGERRCVAMVYSAFKRHHPRLLCVLLLALNLLELGLISTWQPHDQPVLNDVRQTAAVLGVIWWEN
jgi:hypothetical protein